MTNRRTFLRTLSSAAALPLLSAVPALAKAPMLGTQAPGFYRFKVGSFEVTALMDGFIDLAPQLFGANEDAAKAVLANTPQQNPLRGHVNAFVVNTGDKLIAIDSGGPKAAIPTLGGYANVFEAAGFKPEDIDTVLLTHLHIDHVGGLFGAEGKAFFPNANLVVAEEDHAFLTNADIMAKAPEQMQGLFQFAQSAVNTYKDRLTLFKGEKEVVSGLVSMPAHGHTPGHTAYRVTSGNDQLLIWGDALHAPNVQFANPSWSLVFDTDQDAAAKTRARIMDMAAADKLHVAGMHLHFPATGFVEKSGSAYGFTPAQWQPAF
jgi:glyoxylase-like metal-dependent hydrolase (beta-lactamase superfamily II)